MTRLQRWLVLMLLAWELPAFGLIAARAAGVWADETGYYDVAAHVAATWYGLPWRLIYTVALAPMMLCAVLALGEEWATTGRFRLPTWARGSSTSRQRS